MNKHMKFHYALAALTLCLPVNAQGPSNLSDILISYRIDPWLVSGNYVGGLWVSPPVFGPVTQGGTAFTLQVRAEGLDVQGQLVPIDAQWTSANPSGATVSPTQGSLVALTVQRPGQSVVRVTALGVTKELTINAVPVFQGAAITVEIAQKTVTAAPPGPPSPPSPPPTPLPSLTGPNVLTFESQVGGAAPQPQTVDVGSSNGAPLQFTAADDAPWLSVSPASGSTTSTPLSVSVNPASLAAGAYSGTITVVSPGAANSPLTIAVILNVSNAPRPSLLSSPGTLSFSQQVGGPAPGPQSASVASSGAAIGFTAAVSSGANWLSVRPAIGSTPATVVISANAAGLAPGTYNGAVTVSSADAANSLQTIAVTLTVTAPAPGVSLSVNPAALTFRHRIDHERPRAQRVAIVSKGSAIGFTVSAAAESGHWLSASPSSGATPAVVSVTADPTGLTPGTYEGLVTISAGAASNSPQVVAVTLVVRARESDHEDH